MEFHNAYPQSVSLPSPLVHQALSYPSLFLDPLLPEPSQSYVVCNQEENNEILLEAITDNVKPESTHVLDLFLSGKKRFSTKTVEEILGLIYERERIRYEHRSAIDYEQMRVSERLLETGTWRTGFSAQLDKTRAQLHGEIANLDREKRMEDVACWRDITRLKEGLREALRDFDHENRKELLIPSDHGNA